MIEHEYVALKLVNGDNLISLMVDEDENRFILMFPVQMKSVQVAVQNKPKEVMAGVPWCTFTDHEVFQIWKNDVLMIKPLNEQTTEYYKKLINFDVLQEFDEYEREEYDYDEDEEFDFEESTFLIRGNKTIN